MIDYIVKHQNSYVYSNLFKNNLVELIDKGAEITKLLGSDILYFQFDYDQWPDNSTEHEKILAPYLHSMLKLRFHYQ